MKFNTAKTKVTHFVRTYWSTSINFVISINRTETIKDLRAFLDSKVYFHSHVNYTFSIYIKLLGLVRSVTFSSSSLKCTHILNFTLVRFTDEYASVVWNSITFTDANKLERIQQKFAALHFNCFFLHVHSSYAYASEHFKLHTKSKRRYHVDKIFLVQIYLSSKLSPSFWNLSMPEFLIGISETFPYSLCTPNKNCPLLDALQLLMLFVGMLKYSVPKMFVVIMFNISGTS
jgi:hypothetical protein